MSKKFLFLALIAIMMLGIFGLSGCENAGKEFDVDGWTLFQFGSGSSKRGQVNILSADESLVVDGILHVPAKIGIYDIHGFGTLGAPFGPESYFIVPSSVEKIVLAAELYVDELFGGDYREPNCISSSESSVKYIEFLCWRLDRIAMDTPIQIFIIPDGSTHNFISRFENRLEHLNFIEKSEFLDENI